MRRVFFWIGLVLLALISLTPSSSDAKDFTIIVLPDTQKYSDAQSVHFPAQTQWIVDNKDDLNIVYVAHEGDITDNYNADEYEWIYASAAMGLLEDPGYYGACRWDPLRCGSWKP